MMDIEGLKAKTKTVPDQWLEASFARDGDGWFRRISLKVMTNGNALAQYIEGEEQQEYEQGECVAIVAFTEELGDRVVRALAKIHLGAEEAANHLTDCDSEMIIRGFGVGHTADGLPAWMKDCGSHTLMLGTKREGGLPAFKSDEVCLIFATRDGSTVTTFAANATSALFLLDSGRLPSILEPGKMVELAGVYKKDVTLH